MDSEIPQNDLDPLRQMDRIFGRCLCNIVVDGINYTLDCDRSYGTRLLALLNGPWINVSLLLVIVADICNFLRGTSPVKVQYCGTE
jgi:hypothetical protein